MQAPVSEHRATGGWRGSSSGRELMKGSWVRCLRHHSCRHGSPELAQQTSMEGCGPVLPTPTIWMPLYRLPIPVPIAITLSTSGHPHSPTRTCLLLVLRIFENASTMLLRMTCEPCPGLSTIPGTRRLCYNTNNMSLWAIVA